MKIIVCIKEVPDTEAYLKIGADQKSVVESNVTFVINPYDEYAIEASLRIAETAGGETTAVCLGTERADEVLRSAVAMGVQKAVRIPVDRSPADSLAAARMLAEVLKTLEFDLLLLGKETIDDGSQALGPMLGELLGVPCISLATKLEVADGRVTVEREADGGVAVFEAPLPCIVTAHKGLNEPRYPSLRGKMMAKNAAIEIRAASAVDSKIEIVSMANPPARGAARVVGEGVGAVPELVRLLREEAKAI